MKKNRASVTWETLSCGFIYEQFMSQNGQGVTGKSISKDNGHRIKKT